jgi:Skp family chaperone for outer membrane proteins
MKNSYVIGLSVLFSILVSLSILTFSSKDKTISYIDLRKVYDNFQLKSELESKFKTETSISQDRIESIDLLLDSIENKFEEGNLEFSQANQISRNLNTERQNLQFGIEQLQLKYDQQINSQLQSYLNEFGEQQDVKLLLALDKDATILYEDSTLNLSDQAIEFINKKYNGQ